MEKVRIVSLNVRGLKNKLKRQSILQFLKGKKYDIVCIQEAHVTSAEANTWEKQWGGKIIINEGTCRSKGEMILISKRFTGKVNLEESMDRVQIVSVQLGDVSFIIANVYAPNDSKEKIQFLYKLRSILHSFMGKRLLLLGDFNTVVNNDLDIVSGRPHCKTEINTIKELITSLSLTDVWRVFHDMEKEFTWCRYHPFIARRLDYCFADEDILQFCVSCEIVTAPNTDHKAVVLEMNNTDFVRGPGYWRFNNSYLNDSQFTKEMNEMLDRFCEQNADELSNNQVQLWELCKVEIRDFCIEYGKYKSCVRRNNLLNLQSRLAELEQQVKNDTDNAALHTEMLQVKEQLEVIYTERARGAQVRARVRWIEEGEKKTHTHTQNTF